jgi:hypothetical protein
MLDYKTDDDPDVKGMIDNSTWNEQRAYVFNDRGDVLIDLYKFNEKVR